MTLKLKVKKPLSTVILICVSSFAIIISFILFLCVSFDETLYENSDINKYSQALRMHGSPEHFPKYIPKDAKNVYFFDRLQFLQAGSEIHLRYKTTKEICLKKLEEFSKQAIFINSGGFDQIAYNMCVPDISDKSAGYGALSNDFKIIVLQGNPYKPYDWNHGCSYGIAVSLEKEELAYWADYW